MSNRKRFLIFLAVITPVIGLSFTDSMTQKQTLSQAGGLISTIMATMALIVVASNEN